MAHRQPPCPVAGSRVAPRVTLAVSRAWPGAWAHSPLGQAGTTAVQRGNAERHISSQGNFRKSSSLGPGCGF